VGRDVLAAYADEEQQALADLSDDTVVTSTEARLTLCATMRIRSPPGARDRR